MAGPAKELQSVAGSGRWKGNVQRDMLRKVQNVASCLLIRCYLMMNIAMSYPKINLNLTQGTS